MIVRAMVASGLALLLGAQVVRNSAVSALAENAPHSAARAWPGHPDVQLAVGMTDIATAAREGRPVPPTVLEAIYDASTKAPLAPEPYLVRGVEAQLSGNGRVAEQAFLQAKWRDARSQPARYFLADHFLRQGDAARGLREVAVLARLIPDGLTKLAPYVARYAGDPANRTQLRALFRAEPAVEEGALKVLASDPRTADLVLPLSSPQRRNPRSGWLPGLLSTLVTDRQYSKARKIWAEVSGTGTGAGELVFDPRFTRKQEPPPFNWLLTSSTVGLAERQHGGGLRVIYYGQEDGPLATQLLVLPPGTYRLATKAAGTNQAGSLSWTMVCAPAGTKIASAPLEQTVRGNWRFTVPASCPAQGLELHGTSSDSPRQVDVLLHEVSLTREQPRG